MFRRFAYQFLFILILFGCFESSSQAKIDSLKNEISKASGVKKAELLRAISLEYYNQDPLQFRKYAIESAEYSEEIGSKYDQAYALRLVGISYDRVGEYRAALPYIEQALEINKSIGDIGGIDACLSSLGIINYNLGNYAISIDYYLQSLRRLEDTDDYDGMALINGHIAAIYVRLKDNKKAIEHYDASFALKDKINDPKTKSTVLNNYIAGLSLKGASNKEKAEVLVESIEIKERINDVSGLGSAYSRVAQMYLDLKDTANYLKFMDRSQLNAKQVGDQHQIGTNYYSLGRTYVEAKKYDLGIHYLDTAYEVAHKIMHWDLMKNISYMQMSANYAAERFKVSAEFANLYAKIKDTLYQSDYAKSISEMQTRYEAEKKEKEIALLKKQDEISQLAIEKKNEEALRQLKELELLELEKLNEEALRSKAELEREQAELETESKAKELELLNKDKALVDAENEAERAKNTVLENENILAEQRTALAEQENAKKNQQLIIAGVLGVLVLFFAVFIFRSYQQKRKANQLLGEQNLAITNQKEEILEQKVIIEEKNKDIVDSINYARRLQEAILPTSDVWNGLLPQSFVLFLPKDIVSGDFYWLHEHPEKVFFASVDCTGHGVPGAMVSMVGNNGLNRAVKEFALQSPATILDKLNELTIETFSQQGNSGVKDGMDIAMCSLNMKSRQLEYAGANNPLWIVSKSDHLIVDGIPLLPNKSIESLPNLFEVKADKQPIGPYEDAKPFTNHIVQLNEDDRVYVFTDGYADQFGGDKGKKLKYGTLKKLLIEQHDMAMGEQDQVLQRIMKTWKGDFEQVDDICVIGVKV